MKEELEGGKGEGRKESEGRRETGESIGPGMQGGAAVHTQETQWAARGPFPRPRRMRNSYGLDLEK